MCFLRVNCCFHFQVAEKEIRLLQRTLVGLTEKNLNFRASFQRLELESDEVRDQMQYVLV